MVKRILVVDDESDVRYTLKNGLEGLDKEYKVVDVESGKKCFEVLEKDWSFDLIILDIIMPEMNGWEIQRRLMDRVEWRTIPILFLTAVADSTSKRISNMISTGVVEKPVSIPELKQRIDKILHR